MLWPSKAKARRRPPSPSSGFSQEKLLALGFSNVEKILAVQSYVFWYSKMYGVDPALVSAVIQCESGFRPDVVSSAGAVGLMQLMPKTKAGWAAELGIDGESTDPNFNVRLGTYGLSKLLRRWDGNVPRALASYNWGIGNVLKSPDDYPSSTQKYIQCVLDNQRRFAQAMER